MEKRFVMQRDDTEQAFAMEKSSSLRANSEFQRASWVFIAL
jgi:hypothetical protein